MVIANEVKHKGNGECRVTCRATCDHHMDLALRTLRTESDIVAAAAVVREEGSESRRRGDNLREAVADIHRSQAQLIDMLRRIEDKLLGLEGGIVI